MSTHDRKPIIGFFDLFNLYIMSVNCFSNVPAFEGSKTVSYTHLTLPTNREV